MAALCTGDMASYLYHSKDMRHSFDKKKWQELILQIEPFFSGSLYKTKEKKRPQLGKG